MGLMKLMAMGGEYKPNQDDSDVDPEDFAADAHYSRRERKQEKRKRIKQVNRDTKAETHLN